MRTFIQRHPFTTAWTAALAGVAVVVEWVQAVGLV